MTIISTIFFFSFSVFFVIRYLKLKKTYDLLMIFVSLYAGIMSVELISLSTTVSYVLDTIVIVLVIISVILFLKDKKNH
ncbi:hypothetical protein AB1I77_11080 [Bacillus paranthracis]|uniref:hypothetical protein n=1 Tax=Bacillus sp. FSL W8-0519 TaxID=2954624 RepID=UPI000200F913|nr:MULTISPECIES: hypothetical protein [Bacillus]ADY20514.1 hypothetical protein YBT020_06340 [Bacillus thuringiensis serovar finitimus YBT-020]ASZ16240.1 hypothetical protein CK938_06335 [Bacillus cereus]OTX68796.1 hypothetical protein BK722_19500 [Bacillus thuringiensis serovar finitimus]KMP22117.1 hypothetical protein TU49_09645 [Bacillus cereus]KXY03490.1 hypothetical protein AT271_11290 [Bacillus cereus]